MTSIRATADRPYNATEYWEQILEQSFDLRGVGWPDLSRALNEWQYRGRVAALDAAIPNVTDRRVLDVGSGTGFWVAHWHARAAASVTGIDLTETSVVRLRKRYPSDLFVRADLTQPLPLDGPFDLISAIDVLLHITDDQLYRQALTNLRAVAAPGARLILIEPITVGPAPAFIPGTNSRSRPLPFVRRALEDSGWVITNLRPALWMLTSPIETHPRVLSRVLRAQWALLGGAGQREWVGAIAGRLLYPLDRALCHLPWGPTSKALVAVAR